MKKILLLNLIVFHFQALHAQQTFQSAIGGSSADAGKCIISTTDGGYAIAGNTKSYGVDSGDVYIVKLNSSGGIQWTKTIGGPSYDGASCIIQTNDGGYAVTGRTGYWTFEMYIIKLDSSGNVQWTKKASYSLFDQGYSIIQTSDGGYAISGRSVDGSFNYAGWLLKLNSAGAVQWSKTIDGFLDGTYSVVQTNDKGYVLSGATGMFGSGSSDLYVVKLDSIGNVSWKRTIGGTGDEQLFPSSKIVKTNDGGFALAGFTNSFGAGGNDVYIVKLGSNGTLQWTRVVGGPGEDRGNNVIQTSDHGFVIAGETTSFGAGNSDAYIMKLDSNGVLVWTRTTGGAGDDAAYSVVQTSGGGFLLTGSTASYGSGNGDVYLFKLTSTGTSCNNSGSGGASVSGGSPGNGGGNAWALSSVLTGTADLSNSGGIVSSICFCLPSATISHNGPLNFCTGGSVILSATVAQGMTYQWKKNGTALPGATLSSYIASASGTYKVTVTNTAGGCSQTTGTGTVVTVYSNPTATVTPQGPTTFCLGDSVQLKANYNSSYAYQWKKNNVTIAGATSHKYVAKTAGNYKVKETTVNGCTAFSQTIQVTVPCREFLTDSERMFKVYPNPAGNELVLQSLFSDNELIEISVFNSVGQQIVKKTISEKKDRLNCSAWNDGLYNIVYTLPNGQSSTQKILISR